MYGQETNQQQQPQTPSPRQFPMDTVESNDWSITFDDSGQMQIKGTEPAKVPAPIQEGISQQVDQGVLDKSATEQNVQSTVTKDDTRIAQLEATVQQQNQVLSQLIPALAGFMQGQQVTQPEPQYDLTTVEGMTSFMDDKIQKGIKASVDPIMNLLQQIVPKIAYQDTATKYGAEFQEMQAQVQTLLNSNPGLPVEQAFAIVKSIKDSLGKSAKPVNTTQQTQARGPAQELIQKAQQLASPQGVNGSLNGKPQISSLRDALEAAIEEHGGFR